MKTRLVEFIGQLREAGVRASVAESLDAMAASAAVGVERDALRAGLAAALIKDHADRPTFDELFDRFFAAPRRVRGKAERPQSISEGLGQGMGEREASVSRGDEPQKPLRGPAPRERAQPRSEREDAASSRVSRQRELLELPFDAMDARAVEESEQLVAELSRRLHAHVSRRSERAPTGRLDFRRTIRASLGTGGVPIDPKFRARRPGKLDLIGLCDLSYSAATSANFCLSLLAPAAGFFRRVHFFGYVDRLVEISFEHGHVIPHQPLDLAARSDFGQVLRQLWERHESALTRDTLVLILGDARNNRRPPRADILARIYARVRRVVWLNPEPRRHWNTGDSVVDAYARNCTIVYGATNLRELVDALRRSITGSTRTFC